MNTYNIILFDLDGTLTDPKEGITKSIQYALQKLGIIEIEKDKIKFTPKGKELAQKLIKAHELWETYLKSHNIAEKLEHYSDEEIIRILNEIVRSKD